MTLYLSGGWHPQQAFYVFNLAQMPPAMLDDKALHHSSYTASGPSRV